MKKTNYIFIFFFLVSTVSKAQRVDSINDEIKKIFLDTLYNWNSLVTKAKNESKYIYLYYHHPQFELGYELKEHFLNTPSYKFFATNFIIVDIEVGNSDKRYYKTNVKQNFIDSLKKAENLRDRTMNLIYNKDGELMSKFNFNYLYIDDKINRLKDIIKGKYDYHKLMRQYNLGNRNPKFIKEFYETYEGTIYNSREDTLQIFKNFLNAYPGNKLFTKANGKLVYQYADYICDDFTKNLFLNKEKWYSVIGKNKVDGILIQELSWHINSIKHFYFRRDEDSSIYKAFIKCKQEFRNYDEFDSLILYKAKARFYRENKSKIQYINTLKKLLEYGNLFKENDVFTNEYTWVIFENVDDKKFLKATLKWCKEQLAFSKEHQYVDTYANLLYKLGHTNKAIRFEKKALSLTTSEKDKKLYNSVIIKMKNNEQTW